MAHHLEPAHGDRNAHFRNDRGLCSLEEKTVKEDAEK
jgi:hypothetical protein